MTVRVANSYSATENPALLCAVTLRLYQVAGFRSRTTKLPPALTLLDTKVQSWWFLEKILGWGKTVFIVSTKR